MVIYDPFRNSLDNADGNWQLVTFIPDVLYLEDEIRLAAGLSFVSYNYTITILRQCSLP